MPDYDERETVIRMGEKSEPVWIWTSKRTVANRLKRKGHETIRVSMGQDGREIGWWFELPPGSLKLRVWPAGTSGVVAATQ